MGAFLDDEAAGLDGRVRQKPSGAASQGSAGQDGLGNSTTRSEMPTSTSQQLSTELTDKRCNIEIVCIPLAMTSPK